MKITSSTIEYTSTHFLGSQERDSALLDTKGAIANWQTVHDAEHADYAYDVQLSGLAAKQADGQSTNGITHTGASETVPIGDADSAVEAASEAELAKLSPEDRQKVQSIQNYIGLMTGGKFKVVVGAGSSNVVNGATATDDAAMVNVESGYSDRVVDITSGNAKLDLSALALDPAKGIVGVISQQSQSTAIGDNMIVLGETNGDAAETYAQFKKTNTEPGLVTFVGNTMVFVPFNNADGSSSGLGIGTVYSASQTKTEEEYTAWSEKGTVTTADGRVINIDKTSLLVRTAETQTNQSTVTIDPLVIQYGDSSGQVELTEKKYNFDLDSDGKDDSISFVGPGAGFLAFDENGDGKINDGSELFGTQNGNGFADLARYDEDNNGWIDENDSIYGKLSIWSKDEQGNDTMLTLKQAGVGAIYLGSVSTEFSLKDQSNQTQGQIRQSGMYLHEDGTVGTVQQIDLTTGAAPKVLEQPTGDGAATTPASTSTITSATSDAWKSISTATQTQAVFADGYSGTITAEPSGDVMTVRSNRTHQPITFEISNSLHLIGLNSESIVAIDGQQSKQNLQLSTEPKYEEVQQVTGQNISKATSDSETASKTEDSKLAKIYITLNRMQEKSDIVHLSKILAAYRKHQLEEEKREEQAKISYSQQRLLQFNKHINIML